MARLGQSSSGGLVSIQDTNGNPLTSTGGALNVNVSSSAPGTGINVYNEVTGVPINVSAIVLSYTVPVGNTLNLSQIEFSSDSICTAFVTIDSVVNDKKRVYYSVFNLSFDYYNIYISSGSVVTIQATNNTQMGSASFNATLKGILT